MKFKVFENTIKANKEIYLRLEQDEDDSVELVVCDETGMRCENGSLLGISEEGVRFHTGVSPSYGFDLGKHEALKIVD